MNKALFRKEDSFLDLMGSQLRTIFNQKHNIFCIWGYDSKTNLLILWGKGLPYLTHTQLQPLHFVTVALWQHISSVWWWDAQVEHLVAHVQGWVISRDPSPIPILHFPFYIQFLSHIKATKALYDENNGSLNIKIPNNVWMVDPWFHAVVNNSSLFFLTSIGFVGWNDNCQ